MPVYNQLDQSQLRDVLIGSNNLIANDSPFNNAALGTANYRIFGNDPVLFQNVQNDSAGGNVTLAAGNRIFTEHGAVSVTLTTNGEAAAIVMNSMGDPTLTVLGSVGDAGDVIYGDNANGEVITVTQGANYVFAGSGSTTLQAGSGADTMWGGGNSVVKGGTGDNQRLSGGFSIGAHDTLIGGSGTETLWTGYGDNSMVAGSGSQTLYSGIVGNDSMVGGGKSDMIERGANVTMWGGANSSAMDTMTGGSGFDSMVTTAGTTDITTGSGSASITSGGSDSIYLTNGGYQQVTNTGGADTAFVGGTNIQTDTISAATGSTTVEISASLGTGTSHPGAGPGGSTVLAFSNGTSITYSGNVTIDYSSHNFS